MTSEHDALAGSQTGSGFPSDKSVVSSEAGPSHPAAIEPGELEKEHSRLMRLQGQQAGDQGLVEQAGEFVARVKQLGLRLEDPRLRQHWQGILTYWSIYAYRIAQVELDTDLLPFDPELVAPLSDDQYPYYFEEGMETRQMQGWQRLLDECEVKLADNRLVTVVGDAGSGRRFLIRELLLPMLGKGRARQEKLSGNWRYLTVSFGEDPERDFVRDLVQAIAKSKLGVDERVDQSWVARESLAIRKQPTHLKSMLEGSARTVLFFNHSGELLSAPPQERDILIKALANLLADSDGRFLLANTLSRRQLSELSKFGPLQRALQRSQVDMVFTTPELRHLIEEPARRIGLMFERGLVDRIMIDIQGEPATLPLLQFTLRRLWARRERNRITWKAYEECHAGIPALQIAMDEIYNHQSDEGRLAFRKMLEAMANLEPNGEFVVCSVSRDDLYRICGDRSTVDDLISKFLEQELMYERGSIVMLRHHALLRAWPPLAAWLDELQVKHRFRLRLKESANLWQKRGKHDDLLWRGAMLVEAVLLSETEFKLTTPEQDFLAAGRQRETRKRRNRNLAIGSAITVVVAALLSFPLASQHDERQVRRTQNALECLTSGDLPGTLLWLNARDKWPDLPLVGSKPPNPMLRQTTQMQLPLLSFQRPGNSAKNSIAGLAVSDDGKYVAMISNRNQVEIASVPALKLPEAPSLAFKTLLDPSEGSVGCIAFLTMKPPENEEQQALPPENYFFAGVGKSLQCWRDEGGAGWKSIDIEKPEGFENSTIVDLDAGGGLLAVTQLTDGVRSLRVLELKPPSERPAWHLEPFGQVDELDVQLARLSSSGDLVAVCGSEADAATILKAWRKNTSERKWEKAVPPQWVTKLWDNSKENQRLLDWGWTLTKRGEAGDQFWRRNGSYVRSLTFSPSGQQFATASNDGQVLLWSFASVPNASDLVTPKFETELQLGSAVWDITFLNEDLIATGGRDRTARIWNIHSGTEVAPRTYHEATARKVSFVPGLNALLTGTERIQRLWWSPEYSHLVTPCLAQQMAVSARSHQVFFAEWEGPDSAQALPAEPIKIPNEGERLIVSAVISPLGQVACAISIPRPKKDQQDSTFKDSSSPVDFSIAVGKPSEVNIVIPLQLAGIPLAEFSSDDQLLVVAERVGRDGSFPAVYVNDAQSLIGSKAKAVADDWIRLAPANQEPPDAGLIRFTELAITKHNGTHVLAIVGRQSVNSGGAKGVVYFGVHELDSDGSSWELRRLQIAEGNDFAHEEEVLCVGFSPTGKWLATGSVDNFGKLWDVEKLIRERAELEGDKPLVCQTTAKLKHTTDVESLAFSPSVKRLLATVSSEGEAALFSLDDVTSDDDNSQDRVFDVPNDKLRHDAQILCIAFSPSGESIVTGGLDRTARIWRKRRSFSKTRSRWELVGIFQHQFPVINAWMPKENQVLTASRRVTSAELWEQGKSYVRFWEVPSSPAMPNLELHEKKAARTVSAMELIKMEPEGFFSR